MTMQVQRTGMALLLMPLLVSIAACNQSPNPGSAQASPPKWTPIPFDEKVRLTTELIKSVRIEIEGVGECRLVDSDWSPTPSKMLGISDSIEIRFPEGLPIRLSLDELNRPAGIKKMAVRFPPATWVDPGESTELTVSVDEDETPCWYREIYAGIWDSNPDQRRAYSGTSHGFSIFTFKQSEYILDWSMDVDRRDPENTIVQVMLHIDPDIQAHIRFRDIDSMGFSPIMMLLPCNHPVVHGRTVYPWSDPPVSFTAHPNLKKLIGGETVEMELLAQSKNFGPKSIKFVARIRIGTTPGSPIAGVGLSGGYSYDPSSPEYREYREKVNQGLIEAKPGMLARLKVPIPNFTEPILRFTPEHPGGVPITPEELKELERPAAAGQPAALAPVTQDASP